MKINYQFNFYINTICNQTCDYCYARNGMKWNTIRSLSNTIESLSWFKNFPRSIISLIGGEPTLHPHIMYILKWMVESKLDEQHEIHIYTNGTFNKSFELNIARRFTWTFSYHGKFTDTNLFLKNLDWFFKNSVNCELTIPAQNMDEEILSYINTNDIKTVITFIHDSNNFDKIIEIPEWVLLLSGPNITNMASLYKKKLSYTGKYCDYNEIDIVNNQLTSNSCNGNLNMYFTKRNLHSIPVRVPKICDKVLCPNDCAFLLPKKYY